MHANACGSAYACHSAMNACKLIAFTLCMQVQSDSRCNSKQTHASVNRSSTKRACKRQGACKKRQALSVAHASDKR